LIFDFPIEFSSQSIEREGLIPEDVCCYIMVQILEALAYINSRHIIHRDVTTKNILILECGTCKLCDFGEACQWDYGGVSGVCGTRLYMAPEVLLHRDGLYLGTTYNENCDVWSLGVILYGECIGKIWENREESEKL
jgi:serine/threonine protein kinase